MVEAVKSLTQFKSPSAQNNTHGVNSGAGQVASGYNNNLSQQGLFDPYSNLDFDMGNLSSLSGTDFNLDKMNMDLSMYGPIALNPRVFGAYQRQMKQTGYEFEKNSITNEEKSLLEPLAERVHEYRILGMRYQDHEGVTKVLEDSIESTKGVPLYLTYCAKDGLKNPNDQVSFENLKNPLKLIQDLMPVSITVPEANHNVQLLTDMAVKEGSPQLAACLLQATSSKGGLLGVDKQTAEKLLIESRSNFDSDADYYSYITGIDRAYQKMFPGKSLDDYIKTQYSKVPLMHFFGLNSDGKKLQEVVDKARQKDHVTNPANYSFGDLSGLSSASPLPALS